MDISVNPEIINAKIERLTFLNNEFSEAISSGDIKKQFETLEAYKIEGGNYG